MHLGFPEFDAEINVFGLYFFQSLNKEETNGNCNIQLGFRSFVY